GGEVSAAGEPVDAVSLPVGSLSELIADIELAGKGLVLCMGKGGVGKTTIAAAIAVALAERGHDVHLTTTDPASHLHDVLPHEVAGLQVTRIDPVAATQQYRERVMATKGKNLDEQGRAHLAEDLMSPCTEEIAVFQQFSRVVIEGRRRFVVVDTAPTGHTLLLLDTAGAYHRDMVRQSGDTLGIHTPLMLLQDQDLTKVVLVTTPEPTRSVKRQRCRRTCAEPGSSRGPGWSTRPWRLRIRRLSCCVSGRRRRVSSTPESRACVRA
ncbi:MAG: ArsA-related P-loop ATPase, partial [Candidatus Nanopelagicales bacterium]